MNIADRYDLKSIVRELETALQIDGSDFELRDMDAFIKSIKKRINRQYQLDLTDIKVTDADLELGPYRASIVIFLENLERLHSRLAGYCQIVRYRKRNDLSLSSINFMGYTEESVRTVLITLQRESTLPLAEEAVNAIKDRLSTIPLCWEKRVLILLVVTHELGLDELMACIAEILYISTLS